MKSRPRDILPSMWREIQEVVKRDGLTLVSSRRSNHFRRFLCLCGRRVQGYKRGDHIIVSAPVRFGA